MAQNIFEEATRLKLRFQTMRGLITVEDLWDIPLQSSSQPSLNEVAINVDKALEKAGRKNFITKNTKDEILELKMKIVKYIIEVKLEEDKERKRQAEIKARRELLMDVIEEKEIDELKEKPLKDLKKEIKKLK